MKRALWLTCGIRGNAGDALLFQVTERLFEGLVDLDPRWVSAPEYIRDSGDSTENVIIGPGGLFVQTRSSRLLHARVAQEWTRFESKRFFLWSTGILQQPTDQEAQSVRRITARADRVIVRATKEAQFFRRVDAEVVRPRWAPCTSLFTDRLLGLRERTSDTVVVNLDDFHFTKENFANHPIRRFAAYANAEGLEVRSMVNAAGDANEWLLDMFPPIDVDRPVFTEVFDSPRHERSTSGRVRRWVSRQRSTGPRSPEVAFGEPFNQALLRHPSFGERYNDCRFAFGKRLHGWLPFMAFDKPAAFTGMAARRGMPKDYFGDDDFLCAVPRKREMTREQHDQMADAFIEKLRFFIANEDALKSRIAERREELWQQLQRQAREFADALV